MLTVRERFDAQTQPGPTVDPELGPCLDWTGATTKTKGEGRGQIWADGRQVVAARLAWEWENDQPVPEGMQVDHRCHRPICVQGSHLRAVTPKQNSENRSDQYRGTKTSRHRGVSWRAREGKWQAVVRHQGVAHWLGYFTDEDEAGAAASAKRLELFTHSDMDKRKA